FFSSDETQIKMLFQMQENVGIIILTFNALQKWHVIYLKLAMPGFDKTLSNLAEWYTAPEITETYGMSTSAIHTFVSKYSIPKKRVNGTLYYSKQHIDKLKE
ncbi:hypothetical protein EZS27_035533, partial [termite gut metagenome]